MPDYVATAIKEWLSVRSEQSAYLFYMKTDWSYKSYQYDLITAGSYKQFWNNIRNKINYAMGGTNNMHLCLDLTAHIFRHTYCTNPCYQVPTISIKKIAQLSPYYTSKKYITNHCVHYHQITIKVYIKCLKTRQKQQKSSKHIV